MKAKLKRKVIFIFLTSIGIGMVLPIEAWMRPFVLSQMESIAIEKFNKDVILCLETVEIPTDLFIQEQAILDVPKVNAVVKEILQVLNERFSSSLITIQIPMGNFIPLSFLYQKGFEVPIQLRIFEKVQGKLTFESQSLGINNVLISIYLDLDLQGEAYLGFYRDVIEYEFRTPLVVQLFEGEVPSIFPYQ